MKIPRKVYMIRNTITQKCYIGSSSNVLHRFRSHMNNLKQGNHPVEDMQSDYDEYGDHFQLSILDDVSNYQDRFKEYMWMDKMQTSDRRKGYNYKDQHFTRRKR